ncbi:MAG: NAD(P)H-hydrate epimerase [Clostridia bacterium]|nr:NAD(P)H-hydrate epimerase [Clostridia bacterium]
MIGTKEMKEIDEYAIKAIGIPSIVLMERASLQVLKNIDLDINQSFVIICGVGNNGGDGLALGRHLYLSGKVVDVFIVGEKDKGTTDFLINLNILNNLHMNIQWIINHADVEKLKIHLNQVDMIIDSIFGIGLTRRVEGIFFHVIEAINTSKKYVLSMDIPSGLNGDTGEVMGISVIADITVTFHEIKIGLDSNREYSGRILVEDIGIPRIKI